MPTYRRVISLSVFSLLMFAANVNAQRWSWPEKGENLKVLPETTTADELSAAMRSFARGLGVRCQHCHDDSDGSQLAQMDFAADTKETKDIARVMMKMVQRINETELREFESRTGGETLKVTCITCHRGNRRPVLIEDLLVEETLDDGVDGAIEEYRNLRADYYGGFTYDFSERALLRVADALSELGRTEDAIAFMNLNLEMYPESWQTYAALGQTYQAMGDLEIAIANVEAAIELNPENNFLQSLLDRLQNE